MLTDIKITKFSDYIPHVLKTESDYLIFVNEVTRGLMLPLNNPMHDAETIRLIRSQHATEGLCTEAGELLDDWLAGWPDKVNVRGELGDLWWYTAVMCDAYGFDPEIVDKVIASPVLIHVKRGRLIKNLLSKALQLLDLHKKRKFYPRDMSVDDVQKMWIDVVCTITCLEDCFGLKSYETMEANVRKLAKRYEGQVFTETAANNRDEKAEMVAIEQTDNR